MFTGQKEQNHTYHSVISACWQLADYIQHWWVQFCARIVYASKPLPFRIHYTRVQIIGFTSSDGHCHQLQCCTEAVRRDRHLRWQWSSDGVKPLICTRLWCMRKGSGLLAWTILAQNCWSDNNVIVIWRSLYGELGWKRIRW